MKVGQYPTTIPGFYVFSEFPVNCRINLILSQLFLICSLFYPVSNFSAVKTYGQILSLSAEFEKYLSLFCISTCPVQFSACPGS